MFRSNAFDFRLSVAQGQRTSIRVGYTFGSLSAGGSNRGDREMKKLLLVGAALTALFGGSALAAELRRPPPPPAPPPVFNWSGCYIGGYVGVAGAQRDATFTDLGNSTFGSYSGGVAGARGSHSWNVNLDNSAIGGGTLGCNWQPYGSPFVFGIEGEGGYMRLDGTTVDPLINSTTFVTAVRTTPDVLGGAKVGDWYGMITGRLGYAWGTWLVYVKGGAAFVPFEASVLDTCAVTAAGCGNWLISTSDSKTLTTGTLGGGFEWALDSYWSVKGEYMFIGLGDRHITTCGLATLASGATVSGGPFCFDHDLSGVHTFKLGVNYHFGGLYR
jgi:outer membrane immunogenic protein